MHYKEAAVALNLSEKTVKYHMGQILDRLHLKTREQAIAYARRVRSDLNGPIAPISSRCSDRVMTCLP